MKKLMLMTAVALSLGGCTTPYLNEHFGDAKFDAQAAQRANPDAPAEQPAAPVEGQVSNAAMDRYHNSYGKPQAQGNTLRIGVGSGK